MAACWKKTKRFFLRKVVPAIGDSLMRHAVSLVSQIEQMAQEDPLWWNDRNKRRVAEVALRAHADSLKLQVPTRLINLTIEAAVTALKDPEGPFPNEAITAEDIAEAKAEGDAIAA